MNICRARIRKNTSNAPSTKR